MNFDQPRNPSFATDVRENFAQQAVMHLIGAQLSLVEKGVVEFSLDHRAELTQQNGCLHAGIITTIADSAVACCFHIDACRLGRFA
ncbi:MAG: PaaI family thioesterase [Pyrinomonadaceae bacterium]